MESTKVKYQLYYYIPWLEYQKLWFDENRNNYGL